jgi:hypothetical protein
VGGGEQEECCRRETESRRGREEVGEREREEGGEEDRGGTGPTSPVNIYRKWKEGNSEI